METRHEEHKVSQETRIHSKMLYECFVGVKVGIMMANIISQIKKNSKPYKGHAVHAVL